MVERRDTAQRLVNAQCPGRHAGLPESPAWRSSIGRAVAARRRG